MEGTIHSAMRNVWGTRFPRVLSGIYPELLWRVPTADRTLYLTFDDGPTNEATSDLLELLDKYGAHATFFLVGEQIERYPRLTNDMFSAGHTLGNHTFTHPDAWRSTEAQIREEMHRTTSLLREVTGASIRLMRPPYGRFSGAMRRWCLEHNHRIVMWDVMTWDFLSRVTAKGICDCVTQFSRPGSIIVLHDNPRTCQTTLSALRSVLPALREDGWQFAAL